ncbi:MAG TPA: dephospho-CoA kinase [Deltaproteobacteria bacterium]|nr:dephospho-CoA kinase [Deltaproteobacteria bacterium]
MKQLSFASHPPILALTGGIASGKSTVARMFRDRGAVVLEADRIAHQSYAPGTALYRELIRRYGKKILSPRKSIDRKKLAKILFASRWERAWLEKKIHPETFRLIGSKLQSALRRRPPLILVEAALHVETGYYRVFPGLILVKASPRTQLERLIAREGLSSAEAKQRLASQMPLKKKLAMADWVIDNSGSLRKTEAQVRSLMKKFKV